ncbi:MAG TPA: hypothetical protein VL737_04660 [Candidatus Pristimantibacillus sp.]|jgi:hypothetical protein|nr:hypothetical protein [Candidatus Pristimantibacillus sp.]
MRSRKQTHDTTSTGETAQTGLGRRVDRRRLLGEFAGGVVKYGAAGVIGNMLGNMDDAQHEDEARQARESVRQAGQDGFNEGYARANREGQEAVHDTLERAQTASDQLVRLTFAAMGGRESAVQGVRYKGELILTADKGAVRISSPLVLVEPDTANGLTVPEGLPVADQTTTDQNLVRLTAFMGEGIGPVESMEFHPYERGDENPFEVGLVYGGLADLDPNDPVGGGEGRRVAVFETPTGKLIQPGVPEVIPQA